MGAQKHYSTQSSYHLFGLPPELRILIYEYALISEKAINVDDFSNSSHCSLTALLETCQAIRKEASPIFYKLNTFLAIIRQQYEGIPQNGSILPTFRTSKTARVGRLVILLVYDDGSKAYSREATSTYLRRVCNAFIRQRPLELLLSSAPDGHPEDTTLHRQDGSRQPIDSAEEDETRLFGLIVSAIRDRPPRYVVEWSRQHLSEWLRFEVENAVEDAEDDGNWDASEEVLLRAMRFREQVAMLSEIPGHAILDFMSIKWMNGGMG
ncbi:hypothetical protein LTR12_017422 [Friedmanniomyces endolithicus]|nr:hypothetical protein LTR12_017422 [Friedmanniomyces endolithicus]